MKTLSMERQLEEMRRALREARNGRLAARLRADGSFDKAFARLCGMRGLNAPAAQKQTEFA